MDLLDHVPVIQDQGLRGTSSWANTWLQRDHHGKKRFEKKLHPVQINAEMKTSTLDETNAVPGKSKVVELNNKRNTHNNVSTL